MAFSKLFQTAFLTLSLLFTGNATFAQCPGSKILVFKCKGNVCGHRCVLPSNIPSGWTTTYCTTCGNSGPDPWFGRLGQEIPEEALSLEVYPSPATTTANIDFYLPSTQLTVITVMDMSGKQIAILCNKELGEGDHSFEWLINGTLAGIYLVTVKTPDSTETSRIAVVR